MTNLKKPAGNSTYKKLAVQWLHEALCFVSSSVLADSFRLRNRQLLLAAKRYTSLKTMDITTIKTNDFIKSKMYFSFLKYHCKDIEQFNGTEQFTLFDKISVSKKHEFLDLIKLEKNEQPVLILTIDANEFIINTTRRFIHIKELAQDSINYSDFARHIGYKFIIVKRNEDATPISIKTDGYISEFKIMTKGGQIVYWNIPTGFSGHAFWNVTKKCEFIWRKYISESNHNDA